MPTWPRFPCRYSTFPPSEGSGRALDHASHGRRSIPIRVDRSRPDAVCPASPVVRSMRPTLAASRRADDASVRPAAPVHERAGAAPLVRRLHQQVLPDDRRTTGSLPLVPAAVGRKHAIGARCSGPSGRCCRVVVRRVARRLSRHHRPRQPRRLLRRYEARCVSGPSPGNCPTSSNCTTTQQPRNRRHRRRSNASRKRTFRPADTPTPPIPGDSHNTALFPGAHHVRPGHPNLS